MTTPENMMRRTTTDPAGQLVRVTVEHFPDTDTYKAAARWHNDGSTRQGPVRETLQEARDDADVLPNATRATLGGSCLLVFDGHDDGIEWFRCLVHDDALVMGTDVYCEHA